MKWTRVAPKADGWYWCRSCAADDPVVLRVIAGAVVMVHLNVEASMLRAEWYGPLKVPR